MGPRRPPTSGCSVRLPSDGCLRPFRRPPPTSFAPLERGAPTIKGVRELAGTRRWTTLNQAWWWKWEAEGATRGGRRGPSRHARFLSLSRSGGGGATADWRRKQLEGAHRDRGPRGSLPFSTAEVQPDRRSPQWRLPLPVLSSDSTHVPTL